MYSSTFTFPNYCFNNYDWDLNFYNFNGNYPLFDNFQFNLNNDYSYQTFSIPQVSLLTQPISYQSTWDQNYPYTYSLPSQTTLLPISITQEPEFNLNNLDLKKFDFNKQTRDIGNLTRIFSLNPSNKLIKSESDQIETCFDVLKKSVQSSPNSIYLATSNYSISYSEAFREIKLIGSALIKLGLRPGQHEKVGLFAKNRPEWVLVDNACTSYSFISVPLYDTLGSEAINFILNQTELKLVFCDDESKALQLLKANSGLKTIVLFDGYLSEDLKYQALFKNVELLSFEKLKNLAYSKQEDFRPPKGDDIFTICYTSGTTALPKGVVLTHTNMISVLTSAAFIFNKGADLSQANEVFLSYLPLAHMFERISQLFVLSISGKIEFYSGDIKKLPDDIKRVKPTILCVVPRLLNRFYAQINQTIKALPEQQQEMYKKAFEMKKKQVLSGNLSNLGQLESAFGLIRQNFGGRLKLLLTGSAPILPEVLTFFRIVSGAVVIEGYGATETTGAAVVQVPGETRAGHVGPPLLACMFKLADVPEMSLNAARDQKGEVLIKGYNVFKGYYKDEAKTREVLSADGWYRTGDIGKIDETGALKIVDRVKNIFKLSQGEYIAPEKLENVYSKSPFVSQIFVYGNSLKSSLVAVVVPEELAVQAWSKQLNIPFNFKQICSMPQFKNFLLSQLEQVGKEHDLKGFELLKDIYIHSELFSIENNLLTSTMKSKRNELKKYFENQIKEMYLNLD